MSCVTFAGNRLMVSVSAHQTSSTLQCVAKCRPTIDRWKIGDRIGSWPVRCVVNHAMETSKYRQHQSGLQRANRIFSILTLCRAYNNNTKQTTTQMEITLNTINTHKMSISWWTLAALMRLMWQKVIAGINKLGSGTWSEATIILVGVALYLNHKASTR